MYNGEISRNTAYNGGGVGVGRYGIFGMSGGKISHNTADRYGGGMAVDGSVTMSGGEILGNTTANGFGGGVVIGGVTLKSGVTTRYGSFTMSGEARINPDNAVGLVSVPDSDTISNPTIGTFLTIGGDFTGSGPGAKIDLLSWTDISSSNPPAYDWPGQAVLTLDSSYYGNLSTLRNRFVLGNFAHTDAAFSNPPVPTPITGYVIGADGKLQ
jgi:hypothetical protein